MLLDNKVYREFVGFITELCRSRNIGINEVSGLFDKCRMDVLDGLLEAPSGFFVLKRDGRVEKFDKEKLCISIANASDEIDKPLNKSDIDNIVKSVVDSFEAEGRRVIASQTIRQIVLDSLKKLGFVSVHENFKNYMKL